MASSSEEESPEEESPEESSAVEPRKRGRPAQVPTSPHFTCMWIPASIRFAVTLQEVNSSSLLKKQRQCDELELQLEVLRQTQELSQKNLQLQMEKTNLQLQLQLAQQSAQQPQQSDHFFSFFDKLVQHGVLQTPAAAQASFAANCATATAKSSSSPT